MIGMLIVGSELGLFVIGNTEESVVGAFVKGLLLGFDVLGFAVGSFEGDSVGKSDGGAVGLLDGIDVKGFTSGDLDGLIVGD